MLKLTLPSTALTTYPQTPWPVIKGKKTMFTGPIHMKHHVSIYFVVVVVVVVVVVAVVVVVIDIFTSSFVILLCASWMTFIERDSVSRNPYTLRRNYQRSNLLSDFTTEAYVLLQYIVSILCPSTCIYV